MDFNKKRQQFAKQQRQKQRQQIFRIRRNLIIQQQQLASIQSKHNQNKFVYAKEFSNLNFHQHQIQQKIRKGQMQNMLSTVPKWVASLSKYFDTDNKNDKNCKQTKQLNAQDIQETRAVFRKLISLFKYCLDRQVLIYQTSNCLAQISSLSKQLLQFFGLNEQQLANHFGYAFYNILIVCNDLRIIFNCVYICGNFHQSLVKITEKNYQNNKSRKKMSEIQEQTINKLKQICSKYPNYNNCLEVLLWYMKNCLMTSSLKIQKQSEHKIAYERLDKYKMSAFSYINTTRQIIVSQCSRICNSQSEQFINYSLTTLKSSFNLLYLTLLTFFKYNSNVSQDIAKIEKQLDECVSTYLSLPSHKKQGNFLKISNQILIQISYSMIQILDEISVLPNSINKIPQFIAKFCSLVCQGEIQNSSSCQVCLKMIQILANTHLHRSFFIKNLFKNRQKIFRTFTIVNDRNYRVGMLEIIEQLQDYITHQDLKIVVGNEILANTKQINIMQQQSGKNESSKLGQQKYQQFMLENIVQYILNIVQLALIDEDAQVRSMGLRIILKFTTNWQLEVQNFRSVIISMNIHTTILEMQQQKQEEVYNKALDIIEQLKLDDLQW